MRHLLIVNLLVWLLLVPATQAQDAFPPCNEADLAAVLDKAQLYDDLQRTATAQDVESLDSLLAFADQQLDFRATVWAEAPRCAEAIKFYWQATRELDYIAAFWAMHHGIRESSTGNPRFREGLNPFIDPLSDRFYPYRFNKMVATMRNLIDGAERPAKYAAEKPTLPACSTAQLASLAPLLPDYQRMIADSQKIGSMDDLLDLARDLQDWRKNWTHESALDHEYQTVTLADITRASLPELPPCREAAELLWLMYRTLNDVVTGTALIYAGATLENHPYIELSNRNADRVDELAAIIADSPAGPAAPAQEWPRCNIYQRLDLEDSMPEYSAFLDSIVPVSTLEEAFALGEAEIAWRRALWSYSPACALDIEEILLLSQAASNAVAMLAFNYVGVPLDSNPYWEERTLNTLLLENFPSRGLAKAVMDEWQYIPTACSDAERQDFAELLAQFHIMRERMWGFGGMEGLLPLLDLMIKWRDGLLGSAPACHFSFEISLLMSHVIDDYAAMIGLIYAEIIEDSNPYLESFGRNNAELRDQVELAEFDESDSASLWRFGGELPACSKDETVRLIAILSEYQALIESTRRIGDLDTLLDFGAAQIAWRSGSWRNLPICAEALELGLLVHHTAGDYFALYAFGDRQDSLSQSISGDHNLEDRLIALLADLPNAVRDRELYPDRADKPQCNADETDRVLEIITASQAMLELSTSYTRWGGLQEYLDARINWRQDAKADLPDCLVGLDLTRTVAQNIASLFVQLLPGVGSTELANDILQEKLAERMARRAMQTDAPDPRPYRNNLPECRAGELAAVIREGAADPAKLGQTFASIGSNDISFAHIDDQYFRIESALSQFPRCAEAIELATLVRQALGDRIAWRAFDWAGFAGDANPYSATPVDLEQLQARYDALKEQIDEGGRDDTPTADNAGLPRCTGAELAALRSQVLEYQTIIRLGINAETVDALIPYIERHRAWRVDFWSNLPGCLEGYEVGLHISRAAGNMVAVDALDLLDIGTGQLGNYLSEDSYHMFNWLILLEQGDQAAIDKFMYEHGLLD